MLCIKIICNLTMEFFFFFLRKKNRKKENIKKTFHTHRKLSGAITLISLHNSSKPNWVSGQWGF